MKQISIIGATFYGNRGAEAMLSTTIAELKKRQTTNTIFNVYSYYHKEDKTLVEDKNIAIYSSTPLYLVACLLPLSILHRIFGLLLLKRAQKLLPKSIQALSKSKALICLAGVSFIDGRNKFLPFNIATLLPAIILGVPIIKLSQAVGPFDTKTNRLSAKIFLSSCKMLFTRGENTHIYAKKLLSPKTNFRRSNDIAFLFRKEYCISKSCVNIKEKLERLNSYNHKGKLVIGLCPSSVILKKATLEGWDYKKCIKGLIKQITSMGHCIALYPNATRVKNMDKQHNNDLPMLNEIWDSLDENSKKHTIHFNGSLNAGQIYQIINECDCTITSRFHAMIASLSLSKPVLIIGWSHKYLEVMDLFEQKDFVLDYKQSTDKSIFKSTTQLLSNLPYYTKTIEHKITDVKNSSAEQIDYISKIIQ